MTAAQADYFLVPLLSGAYAVGQVLETDKTPDASLFCALTHRTAVKGDAIAPLVPLDITAFCLVAPNLIADGTWPIAGFDQIPKYDFFFDFAQQHLLGFPNIPVHDPAVIEAYLNAWHGLYPWDAFGDLFEQINASGVNKNRTLMAP